MPDDFEALPNHLQQQIDAAFDAAYISHSGRLPPKKRRKLSPLPESEPAGGFIIDDVPGGFTPEVRAPSEDDVISLSLVPTALQILDLPPDDEEVLQVFRNAAGGWSGVATPDDDFNNTSVTGNERGVVSRKDWRAVCAVVVGSRGDDISGELGSSFVGDKTGTDSAGRQSLQEDAEEDAGDIYEEESALSSLSSFSDSGEDSDSDEYVVGLSKSRSQGKSKLNHAQARSERSSAPSPREKRAVLDAYALFFPSPPHLSEEALTRKRLTYKDVVRVAELLKEKIKADEITEMLSLFSTGPDASMSFEDFTQMMITAKLA